VSEAAAPFASVELSRFDFNWLIPGRGNRMDPGLLDHAFRLLG
jgi:hypothetical protein